MDYDFYLHRQTEDYLNSGDEAEALQEYVDANYEHILDDVYHDGEYYFTIDYEGYTFERGEDGGWSGYQNIIEDDFEELVSSLTTELNRLYALIKELRKELKDEKGKSA